MTTILNAIVAERPELAASYSREALAKLTEEFLERLRLNALLDQKGGDRE